MISVILYWLCLSEFIRRRIKKVSTSWKPFFVFIFGNVRIYADIWSAEYKPNDSSPHIV